VTCLLVLPAVVAAVSLLGRHWYGSGDQALEVLRIGDVGGQHTPLVGVLSRFGWYHPGPLLFLILAPAQRLLGETGVLAGTALLNAAALVGVALVARRRGGTALVLWTALLAAVLVHALGPGLLLDPWNPWVALLPFLLFALLAWSVACGDHPTLPWAAGVGSFVVQTHVGYTPLVAGVLVVVLVLAVLGRARAGFGRWLAIAGLVTVALWVPPLIQQATGHPGNLGEVASYFVHPPRAQPADIAGGPAVGWKTAFGVMGTELTPPGPLLTGRDTSSFGFVAGGAGVPAVLVLVATVGCGLLAWRRGAADAARLAAVAVVMAVLGLVATARVTGILANYLVRWWWVVALLLWLAIGWCLFEALRGLPARPRANGAPARGDLGRLAPVAGFLMAMGTLVLVAVSSADALPAPLPVAPASDVIAHLAPSTARAVGRNGPYLLSWNDPEALSGVGPGMFTTLRLAGLDVVAGAEQSKAVGAWRVAPPIHVNGVITGVGVPDPTILSQPLQPSPVSRLVASYDPLSSGQRLEAVTLQRRIRAELGSRAPADALVVSQVPDAQSMLVEAGASRSDVQRLSALQARGSPYLVYFTPGPA
jgi:hypothetical protein